MYAFTRPYLFLYVFSLCLAMFVFANMATSSHAQANSGNPFRVEDIKIDITAESAVKARDEAFRKAQKKSVPVLIKQLEEAGYKAERLNSVGDDTLANAISNFEISNEKFSSVRYKAVITFDYDEVKLKRFLVPESPYGTNYTPYISGDTTQPYKTGGQQEVLVLPFLQVGNAPLRLWADNPWLKTWMGASPSGVNVPIGDLADIRDIGDTQALTYNPQSLQNIMSRYATNNAVVLLASYTGPAMPKTLNEVNYGQMNVAVYETSEGRPRFIDQVTVNPQPAENLDAFFRRAIVASMQVIDKIRQTTPANMPARTITETTVTTTVPGSSVSLSGVPSGPLQSVRGRVAYNSISQWMAVQQNIRAIPGVAGLQVLALRPREADIMVSYSGDGAQIIPRLQQQGIALEAVTPQQAPEDTGYIYRTEQRVYR